MHKIFKEIIRSYIICLFKLLIIFNFEWKTKIYKKRKKDTSEEIINNRGKTDDSTNSDVLISMKDVRKDDDWERLLKPGLKSNSEVTD